MKKLFIFVSTILLLVNYGYSQYDLYYNNFERFKPLLNPGYIGISKDISISTNYMIPTLYSERGFASFEMPLEKISSGIGTYYYFNDYFFSTNHYLGIQYSYIINLNGAKLGIGVAPYYSIHRTHGEWVSLNEEPYNPNLDIFNSKFGVYFENDNLYAGFSSDHRLFGISGDFENLPPIYWQMFYLNFGYNFDFNESNFTLTPSTLIRTDLSTIDLSVMTTIDYSGICKLVCKYSYNDAISPIVEITLFDRFTLGYSTAMFFWSNSLSKFTNHEILLKYNLKKKE